jgi:hypothetical protein
MERSVRVCTMYVEVNRSCGRPNLIIYDYILMNMGL